jgi:O-antigen ligase
VSGLALAAFVVVFARDQAFALLGKDATLTGRTRIWAGALRQIALRPALGFGYAAVWDDPSRWGPIHWIMKDAKYRPPHAHNSWIEIRLALGWTGLIPFLAVVGQAWAQALAAIYRGGQGGRGAWLAAPFLAVWTVQTLTESVALTYNEFTWVLLVAVAVGLGLPPRRAARAEGAGASMAAP